MITQEIKVGDKVIITTRDKPLKGEVIQINKPVQKRFGPIYVVKLKDGSTLHSVATQVSLA